MMHFDLENIPAYYKSYIELVKEYEMIEALKKSSEKTLNLIRSLSEEQGEYRYQPKKWSIKESLCHVMDVERIFSYRALRFARNDQTALSGFDDEDYAREANAHGRTLNQLAQEMERLRASTVDLFESFTQTMLLRKGTANNNELSVISLGYIIAGHETHHNKILVERYLNK